MMPLHRLLKASNGEKPSGHCAVITSVTFDIKIMAMAHTWIQRGVHYFVRTCGSSEIHEDTHMTNFECYFGNVNYEKINRPLMCHNSCEVLL